MARFYIENITEPITVLEGSEAHHLSGVLRLGVGDSVELFDGKGNIATAIVEKVKKRSAELRIENLINKVQPKQGRIILVVSLAKAQRFDWMITKCTELGVDHICPAIYERTVKQGKGSSLVTRYNNLAISAAKQCKRDFLPQIDVPAHFETILEQLKEQYPDSQLITASLEDDAKSLFESDIQQNSNKIVFVGPEGGLTEDEEALLRQNSAIPVRLTNTILRIETAAVAIASVLAVKRDSV